MKVLVIGLSGVTAELLFGDERLENLHRLMEAGCYGRLQGIVPPDSVPGWMCMATSQDPGSLGVYGTWERVDRSYAPPRAVTSRSFEEMTIWDQFAAAGRPSVLVGVAPCFPPQKIYGVSVGWDSSLDTRGGIFTHPPFIAEELRALFGGDCTMADRRFEAIRHLLRNTDWGYFHVVENCTEHKAQADGCAYLDGQIGTLLECLDDETAVCVVSESGSQAAEGTFAMTQWLRDQGYMSLVNQPSKHSDWETIDWRGTRVWALPCGDTPQLFFNVRGREPQGVVEPADCELLRNELVARLGALDDSGSGPTCAAYRPDEIYRSLRGVAPELIVDCLSRPRAEGAWILASSNNPLCGEIEGASLLDVAPTLLELAGHEIPGSMQGRSLVAGLAGREQRPSAASDEEQIRQRLSGLGYI